MKRVILADADQVLRSALRLMLERRLENITLVEAPNLERLEHLLVELKPEILLLDWRFAGGDSRSIISRALLNQPGLQVVVLSVREEDRSQALQCGAVGFIYKGDSPTQVLEHIRKVLR